MKKSDLDAKLKWEPTTVQLRVFEKDLLAKLAEKRGASMNATIREAILDYINGTIWTELAMETDPYLKEYFDKIKTKVAETPIDITRIDPVKRKEFAELEQVTQLFKIKRPRGAPRKRPGRPVDTGN